MSPNVLKVTPEAVSDVAGSVSPRVAFPEPTDGHGVPLAERKRQEPQAGVTSLKFPVARERDVSATVAKLGNKTL